MSTASRLPVRRLRRLVQVAAAALIWHCQAVDVAAQSITGVSTPAAVVINTTESGAGSAPAASNTSGTMNVASKAANPYKLTARLESVLPTGLTLTVSATGFGTSLGVQTLSTTAVDVVNNIGKNVSGTVTATYTLSSTVAAGVASSSVGVVYTIVAY